ncbi:ring-cleaving dioxygenase [Lysinibacillus sp. G4S2]|uniref:ring-cleaving dioxygenase n=1 Tax=Lysinibacillus sp. G4S2 TaxID=3055859 RepID=UPI0025A15B5B|nr:ring-cleaving dioxygenase [Lysinibacillus sp. G4S2]MDM5248917.1 ring-cleaving dioxygenase [Lysinibacillus sp. G4S2]
MNKLSGHHHISMLTKNGKRNNDFYTKILGLRRVKKTVNQDSPSMYHLFYGDLTGAAGTELTFFEMPVAGRTVRGTNAITRIGLLVSNYDSLQYWKNRFQQLDVQHSEITTYAGKDALFFEDHEGLRMVLLNHHGQETPADWQPWDGSEIPTEHRILGMGTVEITVRYLHRTVNLLKGLFHYTTVAESDKEAVLQSIEGEVLGEIVVKELEGPSEKPGRGSIHHLALRVANVEELQEWDAKIKERGLDSTGIVDRYYFQSLYFRDRNGILFEMATDGPGFTVDAAIEDLGKELDLPPFLEEKRAEIEAILEPLD